MKYSKKLINNICEHIKTGLSNKDACQLEDISESEFYLWLSDGDRNPLSDKEKSEFSESIKKARVWRIQQLLGRIFKASDKAWQAAAWYLERTEPEEFSVKYKMEHSGTIDGKTEIVISEEVKDAIKRAFRENIRKKPESDSGADVQGRPANVGDNTVQDSKG